MFQRQVDAAIPGLLILHNPSLCSPSLCLLRQAGVMGAGDLSLLYFRPIWFANVVNEYLLVIHRPLVMFSLRCDQQRLWNELCLQVSPNDPKPDARLWFLLVPYDRKR